MLIPSFMLALAVSGGTTPSTEEGRCAWRPGEVLQLRGTVRSSGLTGTVRRMVESGTGRSVETVDLGVIRTAQGYDGHLAWSQDISGASHDLDSGFARALAISEAWVDSRMGCPPTAGPEAIPIGSRTEADREFHVWRISPAGGAPFEAWYAAGSGRLDRALFQLPESRLVRRFSDWRDVGGGRLAPFVRRDNYPEDENEDVFSFQSASVGRKAQADLFARPSAPHDVRILSGRRSTTVPYEDDHRTRVYIPVYLNGAGPFTFELDNGGHFIVDPATAQAAHLRTTGSVNATGAGNAVRPTGFARVQTLRIGEATIEGQPVRVRDLGAQANDRAPRPPRAGILGLELFERLVVAIDSRRRTVTLSLPGSASPKPAGSAVQLSFAEDAPLIPGRYAGVSGDFMLDTGNAGPTIIEDFWAQKTRLTGPLNRGLQVGQAILSRGSVGFGPFDLSSETVSYYGPAQRGSEYTRAVAGVYGESLMSRFNAVYDYSRKTVWLEPLRAVPPLPFNRSGLSLRKATDGTFEVTQVIPGSPGAAAGLQKGDTITALAGHPASTLSRADATALFQQPAGTVIPLKVGARTSSVELRLSDLLDR